MSIRKLAVAVALGVFAASGYVFAQAPAAPAAAPAPAPAAVEEATAEAVEEEVVEEEVAAPEPVAAPEVAAAPVEAAPVAAAPAPAKPETKVDFYGTASYRFRGRWWSASAPDVEKKKTVKEEKQNDYGRIDKKDVPVTEFKDWTVVQTKEIVEAKDEMSFDYLNLLGWSFGAKVKVDDQLSLQFQIGNDVNAGESISWWNNKAPQGRSYIAGADNLYVHLAYAAWNQGSFSLTGGVVPVSSNGTLDLLERSLSTGSYGDAIFQTWSTQLNNSLISLKLGVPLAKEDVKVSAELTYSIIEPRSQTLISGIGTTGASGVDPETGIPDDIKDNHTSQLLILDIPIAAGSFKVTPQFTGVFNRNYNTKLELGDHEFLGGLSLGYKINDGVSLSGNFAAGTVSNENSLVGSYGNNSRTGSNEEIAAFSTTRDTLTYTSRDKDTTATTISKAVKVSNANKYVSNGLIAGIGTTIKAGPGAIAFNVSYGNSFNGADKYWDTTKTSSNTKGTITTIKDVVTQGPNPEDPTGDPIDIHTPTPSVEPIDNTPDDKIKIEEFDPKTLTNKNDIIFDLRYTWNVHPKFTIAPRWRVYITTYEEGSKHLKLKMENRPEIIITGSF